VNTISKTYGTKSRVVDAKKGRYEITVSTETRDRDKDIVRAAGVDTANYERNPIVTWSHLYHEPPIGRSLELKKIPGLGIKAIFEFPPFGTYDKADVIHRLFDLNFINAASIGFQPLESKPFPDGGQDFVRTELLEWGLVVVPSNADSLALSLQKALGKGRNLTPDQERRLTQVLENYLAALRDRFASDQAQPEKPDPNVLHYYSEGSPIGVARLPMADGFMRDW